MGLGEPVVPGPLSSLIRTTRQWPPGYWLRAKGNHIPPNRLPVPQILLPNSSPAEEVRTKDIRHMIMQSKAAEAAAHAEGVETPSF
jgi:hypothetical protein